MSHKMTLLPNFPQIILSLWRIIAIEISYACSQCSAKASLSRQPGRFQHPPYFRMRRNDMSSDAPPFISTSLKSRLVTVQRAAP